MSRSFFKSSVFATLLLTSATLSAHQSSLPTDFRLTSSMIAKIQFTNYKLEMAKLNQLHLDVAGVDIKNNSAEVIINDYEFKNLQNMGFNVSMSMSKTLMRGPDTQYKTSEEIENYLKDMHAKFPSLTEVKEVGKTLLGKSIWAIKISNLENTEQKPAVLFNGMHHAREVMGPEIAIDIIETLLVGHGKDPKITHWVDANQIWVLPMFNVDGNDIVWQSDNMWRKNARGNYGVDINRNYPFAWGTCNGSSSNKSAQDYRGPSAASEPETQVMMNFVKEIRPVFDISYHSYSELVIYPLGCNGERTQNADVVEGLGKEMGKLLGYTAGTAWETLYSVDGGDIDWMYSEYQVIPYVIEVNNSSDGFQPKFTKRQPTVEKNRKAWQLLLDRLDGPSIRGQIIVKNKTANDFSIKVEKKKGNQFIPYMIYRGNMDGSYHLVVNPGDYRLTLSGASIDSATKEVTVGNTRKNLNFNL
jgi:carboxypeptidase T